MRYAPNERGALGAKRRPAMKKISTVQVWGNEILQEQKLTIGVDLGDRWSFYCVLEEADLWKDTAKPHRPGDRNTFALGEPAANGAGARSAGGARPKSRTDHQEQSQR